MSSPLRWRKSSYSDPNNCVELAWRKSSYSNPNDCVELAWPTAMVAVRDSKNPDGPTLSFARSGLAVLVSTVKRG